MDDRLFAMVNVALGGSLAILGAAANSYFAHRRERMSRIRAEKLKMMEQIHLEISKLQEIFQREYDLSLRTLPNRTNTLVPPFDFSRLEFLVQVYAPEIIDETLELICDLKHIHYANFGKEEKDKEQSELTVKISEQFWQMRQKVYKCGRGLSGTRQLSKKSKTIP